MSVETLEVRFHYLAVDTPFCVEIYKDVIL